MHTYPHKIENDEGEVLTFLGVVRDRGGDRMEVTGSIQGDVFFFAGERFDASQASLKKLTDMYEEVVNILTIVKSSGQAFSPDEWAALQKPALQRVSLASSRRLEPPNQGLHPTAAKRAAAGDAYCVGQGATQFNTRRTACPSRVAS